MPDQDDFPTCKTCDKWHEPSLKSHDGKMRALCEASVGTGPEDFHTHADFGCILHSDLQDSDE
jgi:hypothetical protein